MYRKTIDLVYTYTSDSASASCWKTSGIHTTQAEKMYRKAIKLGHASAGVARVQPRRPLYDVRKNYDDARGVGDRKAVKQRVDPKHACGATMDDPDGKKVRKCSRSPAASAQGASHLLRSMRWPQRRACSSSSARRARSTTGRASASASSASSSKSRRTSSSSASCGVVRRHGGHVPPVIGACAGSRAVAGAGATRRVRRERRAGRAWRRRRCARGRLVARRRKYERRAAAMTTTDGTTRTGYTLAARGRGAYRQRPVRRCDGCGDSEAPDAVAVGERPPSAIRRRPTTRASSSRPAALRASAWRRQATLAPRPRQPLRWRRRCTRGACPRRATTTTWQTLAAPRSGSRRSPRCEGVDRGRHRAPGRDGGDARRAARRVR